MKFRWRVTLTPAIAMSVAILTCAIFGLFIEGDFDNGLSAFEWIWTVSPAIVAIGLTPLIWRLNLYLFGRSTWIGGAISGAIIALLAYALGHFLMCLYLMITKPNANSNVVSDLTDMVSFVIGMTRRRLEREWFVVVAGAIVGGSVGGWIRRAEGVGPSS